MKIRSMVLAVSLALVSGIASASSCPKLMKEIDAALPGAKLSAAQMQQVKALRAEGEQLHKNKKHKESEQALNKAKKMLGI